MSGEKKLTSLPSDLIIEVLSFLSLHDVAHIASCCKFLFAVANNEILWKKLCFREDSSIKHFEELKVRSWKEACRECTEFVWDVHWIRETGQDWVDFYNNNKKAQINGSEGHNSILLATRALNPNHTYYWEVSINWHQESWDRLIGVATRDVKVDAYLGDDGNGWGFFSTYNSVNHWFKRTDYGTDHNYHSGDTVGVLFNKGSLEYFINGQSLGKAFTNISVKVYPAIYIFQVGDTATIHRKSASSK